MLIISVAEATAQAATLRLEGRIIGPWVEELRQSCARQREKGRTVTLDLEEVTFVDREGLALVASLARDSVSLVHGSPFLEEQLKATAEEK